MLIDILNVDEFIAKHGWKEVKVSNYFVPNTSENHPDGLVSNEIFGQPGTIDRKTRWGWIDLGDYFMSPHVYYVFSRLKKNIASDMKQGLGRYYIDKSGELVKLEKDEKVPDSALTKTAGTGFNWMRQNWDKISWKITRDMSKAAKDRRALLQSITVEEAFINKYPVMPAFYRDVDFKNQKRNKINSEFYSKMIHYASIIKKTDLFFLDMDDPDLPKASVTHIKMQELIMEIYLFFMQKCSGANGFINDFVVGKATDYGARLVISCPNINNEHWDDCECDFTHSSVPMAIAINIFAPYMIFGMTNWITNYVSGRKFITFYNRETNKLEQKELDPTYIDEFEVQKLKKILNRYKKSKFYRIQKLTLRAADGSRIPINYYFKKGENGVKTIQYNADVVEDEWLKNVKEMTYCEWFTIIADDVLKGKHIFNTRYPVISYNGTYPSLVNVIPSNKYEPVYANGVYIKRFPIIEDNLTKNETEHMFTDTMRMFSVYPSAMGADFDGDQISTQSVLTEEANAECDRHMAEPSNVVGLNGKLIREFPHVVEQGLYGLTYRIPIPNKDGGK